MYDFLYLLYRKSGEKINPYAKFKNLFILEMLEAVTDDFTTIGDHDKSIRLDFSDFITKHNRLASADNCEDDGSLGVIVRTGSLVEGSGVMQFGLDVIHDRDRIATDDSEVLATIRTFDDGIDDNGLTHQTCKGEKTRLDIEDEAGCDSDDQVYPEKRDADREAAVLLDDHG